MPNQQSKTSARPPTTSAWLTNNPFLDNPERSLEILASRRQQQQVTSPKETKPATASKATAPASSTSTTPAAPAAPKVQTAAAPTAAASTSFSRWDAARKAAADMYQSELAGFNSRVQQGGYVDPLQYKRARERYNFELGRIGAEERGEQGRSNARQAREDRKARQQKMAGEINEQSQARVKTLLSDAASQSPKSVDLSAQVAQDASRAANDIRPYATTVGPAPAPQTGNIVANTINLLRNTPTAVASEFVGPPAPAPAPAAPAPAGDGLTPGQRRLLDMLQSGQVRIAQPDTNFINPDIGRLAIPEPSLTGEIGAPRPLPEGEPTGLLQTALQAGFGPGGVLGAPLPPDLARRAIDMAPTQNARAAAEAQAAMASMQEPFWTLVGGRTFSGGARSPMEVPQNPAITSGQTGTLGRPIVTPGEAPVIRPRARTFTQTPPQEPIPGRRPLDLPSSSGPIQGPSQGRFPHQIPTKQAPLNTTVPVVTKMDAGRRRTIPYGPFPNEYPEYLNTLFAKMAQLDRPPAPRVNAQGNVESPAAPVPDIVGQLLMDSILNPRAQPANPQLRGGL